MRSLEQFLLRHRAQLQHYMDDDAQIIENSLVIIRFIDRVLDDWDARIGITPAPYTREEMTFWFCLYQLESVAEIPPDLPQLPFEQYQFEILRQTRELLRKNRPLPDLYYASRPNFSMSFEDEDELLEDAHDDITAYSGKPALVH